MEAILNGIASALGAVKDVCYSVCKNYGLAIILFTLISKNHPAADQHLGALQRH